MKQRRELRVDVPGTGEAALSTVTVELLARKRRSAASNEAVFGHTFLVLESLLSSPSIVSESLSALFGSSLFIHHQPHEVYIAYTGCVTTLGHNCRR